MGNAQVVFGAPYTFCCYGYPMDFYYLDVFGTSLPQGHLQDDRNRRVRAGEAPNRCFTMECGGEEKSVLTLEDAIAHHASGDAHEVLQCMTMLLRNKTRIDTELLGAAAKKFGSYRHLGFLIDVCNAAYGTALPAFMNPETPDSQLPVPSFGARREGNPLLIPGLHDAETAWGCVLTFTEKDLRKPPECLCFPTPSFDVLSDAFLANLVPIADAIERAGIPFIIGGSASMALQGVPRLSPDFDVVLARRVSGTREENELVRGLEAIGMRKRAFSKDELNFECVAHGKASFSLDVLYRNIYDREVDEEMFRRAVTVRVQQRDVKVLSAEDLIVLKLGYGRTKDFADVVALANSKQVDWSYVVDRLEENESYEHTLRFIRMVRARKREPAKSQPG